MPVSGDGKESIMGGGLGSESILAVREKIVLEQEIHYPVMDSPFKNLGDQR